MVRRRQEDMADDTNTSRNTFYGSAPQEMWAQMAEEDTDTEEQVSTCYGSAPEELWTEVVVPVDVMQQRSSTSALQGNSGSEVPTFLHEYLPQIDPSELHIGKKIAEGGQARIYVAVWETQRSVLPVVVKTFKQQGYRATGMLLQQLETQVRKVNLSPHASGGGRKICEVLGFSLLDHDNTTTSVSIVMERMLGDLRNFLDKCFPYAEPDVNFMYMPLRYLATIGLMLSIVEGMEDLHSCGVVHRDLKASNILIMPGYGDYGFSDEAVVDICGPSEDRRSLEKRSLFMRKGYGSSMPSRTTIKSTDDSVRNLVATSEENKASSALNPGFQGQKTRAGSAMDATENQGVLFTFQQDGSASEGILEEILPKLFLEPINHSCLCMLEHRDVPFPLEVLFRSPYRIQKPFNQLPCNENCNSTRRGKSHGLANLGIKIADYEYSDGVIGTGFWRAPEVLQALKDEITPTFSPKADVYSYGMVCYELLTGLTPFPGHPLSDYDLVLSGRRPILPHYLTTNLSGLLQRCWDADECQRPEWSEIKRVLLREISDYQNACMDEVWDSNCTIDLRRQGINPPYM